MLHASVGRGDLYLCLDCCEQRCGECWGASVEFKLDGFLGIQAQVWACWIPGIARLNRLVFSPFFLVGAWGARPLDWLWPVYTPGHGLGAGRPSLWSCPMCIALVDL